MVARLTDNILIYEELYSVHELTQQVSKRFCTQKCVRKNEISYNGCTILITDVQVTMIMTRYAEQIKLPDLSSSRGSYKHDLATNMEKCSYRRLAYKLTQLELGTLLQAMVAGLMMQQNISVLNVQDLIDANQMLKIFKDL